MKEDHRDRRGVRWMENLSRDFRYGMASLARGPGFAAVTIGLLALGIGANTAMFSIVDAVLLKPLPFPEPERMVRVWEAPPNWPRNGGRSAGSGPGGGAELLVLANAIRGRSRRSETRFGAGRGTAQDHRTWRWLKEQPGGRRWRFEPLWGPAAAV